MAAEDIKELTPEQLALIPIIRDEWIKIALDTTPIDKQKVEAAICLAYECAESASSGNIPSGVDVNTLSQINSQQRKIMIKEIHSCLTIKL